MNVAQNVIANAFHPNVFLCIYYTIFYNKNQYIRACCLDLFDIRLRESVVVDFGETKKNSVSAPPRCRWHYYQGIGYLFFCRGPVNAQLLCFVGNCFEFRLSVVGHLAKRHHHFFAVFQRYDNHSRGGFRK